MVTLAADDDGQLWSVGLPLRTTFRAHALECVEHLGQFSTEDGVELSLRGGFIKMQAKCEPSTMSYLGYAISEHVYAFWEGIADLSVPLQALNHHLREVINHLFNHQGYSRPSS